MSSSMRWQYRDPALVWLYVPAYLAHLAEEYFAGFPEWVGQVLGSALPGAAFLAINAVALVAMIAAIRAATTRDAHGWMAIAIAALLLVNALGHLLGSLATGSYSPGLVTGTVIYIPLSLLALIRARDQAPPAAFRRGVGAGLAVQALVMIVAGIAAAAGGNTPPG